MRDADPATAAATIRSLCKQLDDARGVTPPTKWCPECRSAGVVGIEQDECPTCKGTGKVATGVVEKGFTCTVCGQPNAIHHPTCPRKDQP